MAENPPKHTYSNYLQIDQLLASQHQQTDSDDELLFIIIHQSHELWFKLALHELDCVIKSLASNPPDGKKFKSDKRDLIIAYNRLARVSQIQELLIETWGVLRTLTPDEFHVFRKTVGREGASGFQSIQYRMLEFRLGLKYKTITMAVSENVVPPSENVVPVGEVAPAANARDIFANLSPENKIALQGALVRPSIYDAIVEYIAKSYPAYEIVIEPNKDYSNGYKKQLAVFNAWKSVYENRELEPELYQLGEKLVDLEDAFRRWRFTHLATVSRIIGGNSAGTGGSIGLRYLKDVANRLFDEPMYPELWDIRNYMFDQERFSLEKAGYK